MPAANRTSLPPLLVVAAALVRNDGRVLVQQRPTDRRHGGLWEFPGGKVEAGEAPETALARELGEELGIVVAPGDLVPLAFSSDPAGARSLVLLLYRLTVWSGEPQAIEAPAIRWLRRAELVDLPMPPADLPLIPALTNTVAVSGTRA